MQRIVLFLMSMILVVSMFLSGAAEALADSGSSNKAGTITPVKWELMIRAVDRADVSQPVAITVFSKHNRQTVAGAAVYALKADLLTNPADSGNYSIDSRNNIDMVVSQGILVGLTDNNGLVTYKFNETGKYILVTTHDNYNHGFTTVVIGLAAKFGLLIGGPPSSQIGKSVTFTIRERNGGAPVPDAALYGKKVSEVGMPAVIGSSSDKVAYAAEIKNSGIFLGYSSAEGKVEYAFTDSGNFVLVADKDNYAPGFGNISVNIAGTSALVIKAPPKVLVGKEVNIKVLGRATGQPVAASEVYAVKRSDVITSQPGVILPQTTAVVSTVLAVSSPVAISADEARTKGTLIGNTSESGQVNYIFKESAVFMLVALKDGYTSGYHQITVVLANSQVLVIKAPTMAYTGEQVTITVMNRSDNSTAIAGAGVYALKIADIANNVAIDSKGNKPLILPSSSSTHVYAQSSQKPIVLVAEANPSADEIKEKGIFLGSTDANGQVFYTFTGTGRYVLLATKDGYGPAFARINVRGQGQKFLLTKTPGHVTLGEQFTLTVQERFTSRTVEGAAVYALKENLVAVPSPVPTDNGTATQMIIEATPPDEQAEIYVEQAKTSGILMGYTNSEGQLQYTFQETGRFIIVAAKDGYRPGFSRMNVIQSNVVIAANKALVLKVPSQSSVSENVTMSVFDRNTHDAIAGADIYAYRIEGFAASIGSIFQQTFSFGDGAREKFATVTMEKGYKIRATDDAGNLVYSFPDTGRYVLVAIMDGYRSDFESINIKPFKTNNNVDISSIGNGNGKSKGKK